MIAFFFVGLFDQVKVNLTKDPGDWRTLFGIMLWILYLMMLLGGSMISLTELSSLVLEADQAMQVFWHRHPSSEGSLVAWKPPIEGCFK